MYPGLKFSEVVNSFLIHEFIDGVDRVEKKEDLLRGQYFQSPGDCYFHYYSNTSIEDQWQACSNLIEKQRGIEIIKKLA